ncbi:hypothetical protein GBA52_004450, partial [Prunus armeniaca]
MATAALEKLLQVGTKIVGVAETTALTLRNPATPSPRILCFFSNRRRLIWKTEAQSRSLTLLSLDHEVELAVVISKKARDVPQATAMDYVAGYALALDMTAREIQASAKSAGLPWTIAKGQDTFTPISSL